MSKKKNRNPIPVIRDLSKAVRLLAMSNVLHTNVSLERHVSSDIGEFLKARVAMTAEAISKEDAERQSIAEQFDQDREHYSADSEKDINNTVIKLASKASMDPSIALTLVAKLLAIADVFTFTCLELLIDENQESADVGMILSAVENYHKFLVENELQK